VDEGVELRKAGIQLPIMVMSPRPASFDALLAHRLEPEIYSFAILEEFINLLNEKGVSAYPIHLKLDTGMHRLGFSVQDISSLINYLKNTATIKVQSIFSHLAAAGSPAQDAFTRTQLTLFDEFSIKLTRALGYPIIRHIANTAGIQRWPQAHLDMVRLGIGLYGIGNDSGQILSLQPASSLKTTVIQTRKVAAGESVGYGNRKSVV